MSGVPPADRESAGGEPGGGGLVSDASGEGIGFRPHTLTPEPWACMD